MKKHLSSLTNVLCGVLLLAFSLPAVVSGTTYYVDNTNVSASDSNAGTNPALPFLTMGKGASKAVAGDTVRVLAGTYAETVKPNSGTAGNPVTFSAAPGVTVTGIPGNSTNGGGFRITSKSYIVVDGFTITVTADYGIILDTSSYITISNNHVSYSGTSSAHRVGIYLRATIDSVISGNTTDHNTMDGIRLNTGSNYNTVSNNISFGNAEGTVRNATGIDVLASNNNTIIDNITYANEDTGLNFYTGSSYNQVIGNVTCGNGDHGIDNNASPYNVFIGNTVQGNVTVGINLEGATSPGSGGATVINNISVDNGLLRQTDGSTSTGSPGNIRVDAQSLVGTTLDYNMFYLNSGTVQIEWNNITYPSLAAFQAAVPGQEAHGLQSNPLFASPAPIAQRPYQAPYNVAINVGDYHLTAGSPAIDSANADAPSEPTLDIDGNARVDDLSVANTGTGTRTYDDRGAYEFTQNPVVTQQPDNQVVIAGQAAVFNATANGVPEPTVQWQVSTDNGANWNDVSGATSTPFTFVAQASDHAKQYHAVFANAAGTATSDPATLTVYPRPTAVVSGTTTICNGNSAVVTAALTGQGPWNVTCFDGTTSTTHTGVGGTGTTGTDTLSVSPASTTTYTVTALSDANGAAQAGDLTGSAVVTVNPLPTVSVNSATICAGGSATLTATTGASSPSYLWSPGGATTASITVSSASTTTYTVTVTDGITGCGNSGSGTITVNPLPAVSVNSATISAGGSATLTATTGASSPSYLWSPGGATTASITVSPASTTTYTVTVTDRTTGCGNSGSGTVTVQDSTPPTVTSVSPAANASGVPVSATVTATFSEAIDPFTVNSSTFELLDSSNAIVSAAITYDTNTLAATLTPSSVLTYSTTYTATLKGGSTDPRIKDPAGDALPADYTWAFVTAQAPPPEPSGWYAGDMHVHRSCGGSPVDMSTIHDAMIAKDVSVVSLLADMGNGEVQDPVTDLPKVNGQDATNSTPGRMIHWDAEWHWDATYSQYAHQALGGHLVNLGLTEAHQIWEEYTYPIITWVHQQGGISGFCHMQYLGEDFPTTLTCCTPIEYPVEVALGSADFIAEDVDGSDTAIHAYYRLLNCGFRPGLAAGTDYPCGQVIGPMLTYGQVAGGQLTYQGWIDAIARGRTVVSRVGHTQFLNLQVNGIATPGDEIRLTGPGDVQVSVQWTVTQSLTRTIELVCNGIVVASKDAQAGPGVPDTLTATVTFTNSGWLCARVMGDNGHEVHTSAVFVTVNGAPVRARVADANFYVQWMDNLITNTSPGGVWNSYFPTSLAAAQARYQAALTVYQQIAAGLDVAPTVVTPLPTNAAVAVPIGSSVTAIFSEALDASTVSGSTFILTDASGDSVAASVTYDAGRRRATLTPSSPLAYLTTYTATLKGGSSGIKDPAGTALAADSVWSFSTAALTLPTVSSTSPASDASGVVPFTTVSATFNEALNSSTLSTSTFELSDASNNLVPATVMYDSSSYTATLAPSSPLAAGTYTATLKGGVNGITDLAGNALMADYVWSFTVANYNCPCRIFQPTDAPQTVNLNDNQPVELGMKFRSSVNGYITGVRFYKGNLDTGTHIGHLWSTDGTMLAEVVFIGETASGWQEADFASPVSVTAGTTYIISYHSSGGYYNVTDDYFTQSIVNGPLQGLADGEDGLNGVYLYSPSSAFPTESYRSDNYWVDVVFAITVGPDLTPPTVVSTSPVGGATTVAAGSSVTALFSEAIDPASLDNTTFELRDASNALVSATVSYSPGTLTATLTPLAPLAYDTIYTVSLVGGATDPRIKDLAGNALAADDVWAFTTASPPLPPPTEGPGGPILVISAAENPFSRYFVEILRAEGLNEFTAMDISLVTNLTVLNNYDVVILGDLPLTASQVSMLTDWVNAGGNLIAMRPDKQLAGLLGLTDALETLSNAYLRIYGTGAGAGIVTNSIQFHGVADRYTLSGATALASLYSNATNDVSQPAVTIRSVGSNGGHAAAFMFDLGRSVVYTRQGNPAWAGEKRDDQIPPIRSDDLFYGNASFDPEPDWVDPNKVAIPQADEQQRLLANMILQMDLNRKPLPRFWYFPRGFKAVVVMTGDQHGCCDATMSRFQQYVAESPTNGSVADWDCVRASSYVYASSAMTDAQAKSWTDLGFEFGYHINTGCADWTSNSLEGFFSDQLAAFASLYPSVPGQVSSRTHCIAWSDWATQPKVELAHGIRLDVNYYYWPQAWIQDRPGFFTGSGMPMRFADLDGTMIDCYQACTQMTDESGQSYPFTIDSLLDGAVGPNGFYGVFTCNFHTDNAAPYPPSDETVAAAQARGVPVVSGRQMLEWLDGRNNSSFGSINWSGDVLGFTVTAASGSRNIQAMVPTTSAVGALSGITVGSSPVVYTRQTIKGIEYAFFAVTNGTYTVSYAPDTTPPVISAVTASAGVGGVATITWTTDEPSDSQLVYGTDSNSLALTASDASLVTAHSITLTGLSAATTYYFRVTSADAASNAATSPASPAPPASFSTPSAAFLDTAAADFGAGTVGTCAAVAQTGNGEVILAPAFNDDFSGTTLSSAWTSDAWNSGGTATVGGGVLAVNGSRAATTASFGPGSAIDFVATFQAGPFQNVGFASDTAFDPPWVTFGTSTTGNGVYARASDGTDILISASLLGAPHHYRIVWNPSNFVFYVDGVQVATINISVGANMLVAVSDYTVDAVSLPVDWLRVTPYSTSCTFVSRVFDAGTAVNWSALSWTGETPTGTTLALSYRIGNTPTPDGSWSAFIPVSASGGALTGNSRYIQYQAQLATADATQTPVLDDVTIFYSSGLDTTPPVISAVTATPGAGGTTIITWTTDEPANSQVDYGTDPDTLTLTTSDTSLVTTHSITLTGLSPSMTYYFRVTSADASANSATSPASPAPPASFTTPTPLSTFVDTAAADFGAGTLDPNIYIAQTGDGEVTLNPTVGAEFSGTSLPAGWFVTPWVGGGSAAVSGGQLVVDDALAGTSTYFSPGVSLEFVATFNSTNQHVGFGTDFNNAPWAIFSVKIDDPTQLRARTSPNTETLLGGTWLNAPHRYRIDWTATSVVFSIDGTQVANQPTAIPDNMRPLVSDWNGIGAGGVSVDWMRMSPYAAPGTFVSRVFDAGTAANWSTLTWTSEMPTGTTLAMSYRTGTTPTPDGSWTAFAPVTASGGALAGNSRYIQYSAQLATSDPNQTPVLKDATIAYNLSTDTTPPNISAVTVATGNGGTAATVTWTTDEASDSRVDYGTDPDSLTLTASSGSLVTAHSVVLTGLTPSTTYYFRVTSVDAANNSATSPASPASPASFFTTDTTPPVISAVTATVGTGNTATITWTTDEQSDSRVDYGTNSSSLTLTVSTASLVTAHSLTLSSLASSTTYYYRVTSADAVNNSATSPASPAPPASFVSADTTPPVISAVAANTGTGGTAAISWATDESANSRVDYGINTDSLTLAASSASLVTSHNIALTGLAPATTYYFRVTSADAANNSATSPASPAPPASFTTPSATFVDTTIADFSAGTPGTNTYVAQTYDGEVILNPTVGAEFYGSTLPAGWVTTNWASGGSVTVSGGSLAVDGAAAETTAAYGSDRSLEFVATINAVANQHVGFVSDLAFDPPWAIFSTKIGTNSLYARTSLAGGASQIDTVIPGNWIGSPHRYRIDWTAASVVFSVDGTPVTTNATAIPGNMSPAASDLTVGDPNLSVDWMRMSSYPSSGTFVSRVFDAGSAANWSTLSWTSLTPTGTTLTMSYRNGNTPTPDASWTAFIPVATSGGALAGNARYIQYSAQLATSDPGQTPVLNDVTIGYNLNPDATSPTLVSLSPAAGATDAPTNTTVTVSFSEPMNTATITTTTFRLRRVGDSTDVAATVSNPGATATLTPNSPLLPGQSYQVTVAGTVTDLSGNPLGSDAVWTFSTAPVTASQTDTTVADFSAGSSGACSMVVSQIGNGEVILAPTLNQDFSGTTLPADWASSTWASGGTVTVASGTMTVDGAMAQTTAAYGPGRSLEFVATFGAAAFEHAGFATDSSFSSFAMFSTASSTTNLYARTSVGADTLIPGSWLGTPHRFRIDWTASSVVFWIDGVQVATRAVAITADLRPMGSEFNVGGPNLSVDWMRMTPYATPCSFTSRVFDGGQAVTWYKLAWTALTPTGTTLAMSYRTGNTPTPDGSWTAFSPVNTSGGALAGSSRYLQYAAQLATADTTQTPVLEDVTVTYILTCSPPAITGNPSSSTNCAGDPVAFAVTATGTGLTYQWQKDGTNIDDATGSSYTIASVSTGDAGAYDVVVSGPCGLPATSSPATLTVNTGPTITCPANIVVPAAPDQCSSDVTFAVNATGSPAPVVTCMIGSTVIASPYLFPVGTTTVNCTASNSCGIATCSFTVTVNDTTPPELSLTAPAGVSADTNCQAAVPAVVYQVSDNCDANPTVTQTPPAGTLAGEGTTTITVVATDASGNATTRTTTFTVSDTTPPVISWSFTNLVWQTSGDSCQTNMIDVTGTNYLMAYDSCSGTNLVISQSPTNGAVLPEGTNLVVLAVADLAGNTNYSTNTIVVVDATAPSANVPTDIVQANDGGQCGAVVNFTLPEQTDNCGVAGQVATPASGSFFEVGTTPVTVVVTDIHGNSSTNTFQVTVNDAEPPVIVTNLITLTLDASGGYTLTASDVANLVTGSSDNCGIASTNASRSTFSCDDVGTQTVQVTLTDVHGNSYTANATVIVRDITPPVVVVHPITVTLDGSGNYTLTASDVANLMAGSSDNCGMASTNVSPTRFTFCNVGAPTVQVTLTDVHGNIATADATVNVQAPASPPVVVYVDASYGTNCGAVTFPNSDGTGTYFVGYNAFSTIQEAIQAVAAGGTVNVAAGTYPEVVVVNKPLTLSGAQAGQNANSRFAAFVPGANGPKGDPAMETILTAAATDPANAANDMLHIMADHVTVDGFVLDGNNPALPQGNAVAVGGINTDVRRAIQTEDAAGNLFSANNALIENNIIQNFAERGVELVNPTDTSPATSGSLITGNVVGNFGLDGIVLAYNAYADITSNTVITPDYPTEAGIWVQDFPNNGTGAKTIEIANNAVTVGQDNFGGIWVNLVYAPAATLNIHDNTVNAAAAVTGDDDYTFGIYLSSLQGGTTAHLSNNIVGATGGQFARGVALWNVPTTTRTTVIGGTIGHALKGVSLHYNDPNFGPAGASYAVDLSAVSVSGTDVGVLVEATDSGPDTVQMQISGNAAANACTTGISVLGTNAAANIHDNNASITGNGIGISVDAGKALIENNDLTGNSVAGILATNGAVVDAGNCGADMTGFGVSTGGNNLSGYLTGSGKAIINGNAGGSPSVLADHDNFGATSPADNLVAAFSGSVLYSQLAQVTAFPPDVTVACPGGIPPGATDLAGFIAQGGYLSGNSAMVSFGDDNTITAGNGIIHRTYTVTDDCGATTNGVQTITVSDTLPPTVLTKNITIQLGAGGSAMITPADVNNGSSDNCSIASLTVTPSSFDCSKVGANTVQLVATDPSGNRATNTAIVNVQDNTPPTIVFHSLSVQLDGSGNYTLTASDVANLMAGSSDNCGMASTNVSPTRFTFCNVGAPTVQVTLTDVHGNIATADATVNVQAPASPPAVVYVDASYGTNCGAVTFPNSDGTGTYFVGYNAFSTIQEAIQAVAAGGTVNVAAGTYIESGQIHVAADLSIVGADETTTIIKKDFDTSNSGDAKGWWLIDSGVHFNLSNVTLDGTGHLVFQGVRSYGLTALNQVHFTNLQYNASGPDYDGRGVIGFDNGVLAATLNLTNCQFDAIGRIGVQYYGNCSGNVVNCAYTGKGPGDWLDYGFETGAGAVATITSCVVTNCYGVALVDGSESAAIQPSTWFGDGTTTYVYNCTLKGNSYGIGVGVDSSDTSVVVARYNDLSENSVQGIDTLSASVVVDAVSNWWGSVTGPTIASNPGGTGAGVSTNVDYSPWLGDGTDTNPAIGFQPTLTQVYYPPDHLAFSTQPGGIGINSPLSPQPVAQVIDSNGGLDTVFNGSVTIAIANNPSGGVLHGTLTEPIVGGTAIFSDLSIDRAGTGYTLTADSTSPIHAATSIGFDILNPVPSITALVPSRATAGEAGFTLVVNGTNFVSNSVVRWNGSDRATTNASPTQLTAAITAADIPSAGTANVTVFNAAPGGGESTPAAFNIYAVPSVVYVNTGYTSGGTNNGHLWGYDAFNTVQTGINAVAAGGTVNVAAGTYPEVVVVNKPLTLSGAQAGQNANSRFAAFVPGANGPKGDPAMETILTAAATDPANAANDMLHIMADHVTVDGFVLDGNNPALPQGNAVAVGGINTDVRRAIQTEDAAGNLFSANNALIENNIIQNFAERGVELVNPTDTSPATSGSLITGNVVGNFGLDGIVLAYNAYADITSNTVITPDYPTEAGIWVQDFPNNGTGAKTIEIANNAVTVGQDNFGGIWVNLVYAPAATLNIHDNTVNAAAAVTGDDDYTFGIYLSSLQGGTTAHLSNNIVGATGGQFARGVALWNVPTTTRTTVIGGTIGHALKGVSLHYNDPNFGPAGASYAVDLSAVSVSGTDVGVLVEATDSGPDTVQMQISGNAAANACTTGISVLGTNAAANIHDNNASITGNGIGISVDAGKALIENNDLTGNSVAGILATNGAVVDAGNCGADMTGFGVSTGGNNLSGYLTGSARAIINANAGGVPGVLADHNNFGATSPADNIPAAFSGAVEYSQSPAVLSCPGPVTVTCASDVPVGANNLAGFIARGGYYSAGAASVSFSDTPHPAGNGTITRTYTVADACGLTNACTQVITVSNTNPPTIASLPDLSFSADPGQCSKGNVTWTVSAVDYCGQPAGVISIPPSGSTFNTGTTVVTNIATDISGNTAIATFTVKINDNEPPGLSLTVPAGVSADTNCQAAVPAVAYQVSDNCDANPTMTQTPPAGTLVGEGTTTITVVATDASGNATTRTTTFTVNDTTPPVISWSFTNLVWQTTSDSCQTNMIDVTGTNYLMAYDSCSGTNLVISQSPTNGAVLPEGTNLVVLAVADLAGNTNYSTNTIVVVDATAPSANVPTDIVQANDGGQCGAVVNFTLPTQTDNCGVAGQVATPASGSFFEVGTTPVTVVVTDIHGNSSTNTFQVTVNDAEPPSANVPADIVQANDPGQCSAVVNFTVPTQTDNCGVSNVVVSPASGDSFPAGTTPVMVVVTDIHGNSSTNTFHVTVNDTTPPELSLTAPAGVSADTNCQAAVPAVVYQVSDNCDANPTVTQTPPAGTLAGEGTTTITVVATDASGNATTRTTTFTVSDTTPPVISWSFTNLVWQTSGDSCQTNMIDVTGTNYLMAYDSCSGTNLVISQSPTNGAVLPEGTNLVVLAVADLAGNTNYSTNTIVVVDATAPSANVPTDIVQANDGGQCGAVVNFTLPEQTDNCGVAGQVATPASGSFFEVGTTPVMVVVTDIHGNSNTNTFRVTVNDAEPPVIQPIVNMVQAVDAGKDYATVTFAAQATDNCGVADLIATPSSGSQFPIGTNTVTLVATDVHGNSATNTFTVAVLIPVTIVTQPANQTVYVGGTASFSVSASGTLPLTYQWNFNQTNIANATNAVLVLNHIQPDQAGRYAVLVANPVSSILSSNAVLTINPAPVLQVMQSGNNLLIFWPVDAPGFVLETSPSLSPADWVPVTDSPFQIGGEYLELIEMAGTNQFYRLELSQ